jgi:hypothetical protein
MALTHEEGLNNAAVPNDNVGNTRYATAVGNHAAGDLVANFEPFVFDASVTYTLDSFPLYTGPFPMRFGGEYIVNPTVSDKNDGYWLGAMFGKSGKKGTWELSYRYKHLEADAWYEEFVDSDTGAYRTPATVGTLAGSGQGVGYRPGTGLKGHVAKAVYSFSDAFSLGVTYYLYQLIDTPIVTTLTGDTIQESHAHRVQLDAIWKF